MKHNRHVLGWSLAPLLASLFLLDFFFLIDKLIYSVQCCFNRPLCPEVGIITRLPLRLIELEPAITSVLLEYACKNRLAHSSAASLCFDSVISVSRKGSHSVGRSQQHRRAQQRQVETLCAQMCWDRHVDDFEGRNEEFIQTMWFFCVSGG